MIGWPIFQFLSYPISFLFPGYISFKAVMSPEGEDDTRWLCYWVLVGLFFFIETAFSLLVSLIPFYYEMKCALFMALQWNSAKLAEKFYREFLEPLLKSIEPQVDEFLDRYSQHAFDIGNKAFAMVEKAATDIAMKEAQKNIESKINETIGEIDK